MTGMTVDYSTLQWYDIDPGQSYPLQTGQPAGVAPVESLTNTPPFQPIPPMMKLGPQGAGAGGLFACATAS